MVAIGEKPETQRFAEAQAEIRMEAATLERIREGGVGKGDVLGIARLAAIQGAKEASRQIPLCHPVRLTAVEVEFELDDSLPGVRARVGVAAVDRTGPEMEAMVAASSAALTIYDMCKGVDRAMVVGPIVLVRKAGGKSGEWVRGDAS